MSPFCFIDLFSAGCYLFFTSEMNFFFQSEPVLIIDIDVEMYSEQTRPRDY